MRQVLPIAGAVVGSFFGAPQLGFAIGSLIGNAVDPLQIEGSKVGDNPMQTASEGGARAIVFGTGCVRATCLLERGNRHVQRVKERGGKGGPVTVNERVYWTFAVGLGEAIPGGAIIRIWEGEKLVYDASPNSAIPAETAEFAKKFRFYDGSEDQLPDPALEAIHGIGNAHYYRGTAYVVFPNYDLTDYREQIPVYRWEVSAKVGFGPSAIYLALDRSGSMRTITSNGMTRWTNLRTATYGFLDFLRDEVIENSRVDLHVTLWGGRGSNEMSRETIRRRSLTAADIDEVKGFIPADIDNLTATSFPAAVEDAPDFFSGSPEALRRVSLFVTDGEPSYWNGSNWVTGDIANENATEAGQMLLGIEGLYAHAFNIDLDNTVQTAKMDNTPDDGIPVIDGADPSALLSAIRLSLTSFSDSLANIVSTLHARVGNTAQELDVTELTEPVAGVVFESTVTGAEAINSVIGSYFKDASEYDRRVHYISRGKPVVRTLSENDLVDEPASSRRENAIEYPRKLHYFFQSPITHYAATKATSARSSPDVHVIGEASVSSPITYNDPDEPAQVSAKLHKVYWADAEGEIVWHVSDEHADLVPGDCVGLSLRGVVRRARITSIEDDPGVRKLTMRVDRQSAYTSNVTGIPLPPATPPRPSIIAPSVGMTLDIPALTDDADDLHYLRAISGMTDVWAGAVDQRSLDGGASFTSINTAGQAAVIGLLQSSVTPASPHFTDTTNRIVVDLFADDEIESISQQQFLSEGGAFALSYTEAGVRKWELCQYRDAEQDEDGNWVLSMLHRGRLNTDAAGHEVGEYFVLLDEAVLRNAAQSAWLGQELVHRAVSNGLSPETASTETTTYTGQSQREFPLAHVGLALGGDNLTVHVVPRHRFGTDDNPLRSINWTGYRIAATDGANSATYDTTADLTEIDVSGWSGPITVAVAQVNRITGPGPTVTESTAA